MTAAPATTIDPAWRSRRAVIVFFLVAIALLGLDLAVKSVAFARVAGDPVGADRDHAGQLAPIPPHEPVMLVPRVLALRLTVNEGAVFGLGRGGRWIFVAFSVIAVAVIIGVFARSERAAWLMHLSLAAVLAGAIGNLYDRVAFGVVRDMFWLFPGVRLPFGWRWPGGSDGLYPWIFNVADVCLVLGLLTLVFLMYRHDHRRAKAAE